MNQRRQSKLKKELMKKINYFEYAINYVGHPNKKFWIPQPLQTDRAGVLYLPVLSPSKTEQEPSQRISYSKPSISDTEIEGIQSSTQTISHNRQPLFTRTTREVFRHRVKNADAMNVDQIVAKSMTPVTRSKRMSNYSSPTQQKKKMSLETTFSAFRADQNKEVLVPRKRTYIGDVWYVKKGQNISKFKEFRHRKASISAWETDNQTL